VVVVVGWLAAAGALAAGTGEAALVESADVCAPRCTGLVEVESVEHPATLATRTTPGTRVKTEKVMPSVSRMNG
jgi:hypothetical protein